MFTSIIPVCGSHNLTTSESCESRCPNETACCAVHRGNDTTHHCLEYIGEISIERCESGATIFLKYCLLNEKKKKESFLVIFTSTLVRARPSIAFSQDNSAEFGV